MTVSQWIDAYKSFYPSHSVRMMDTVTGKGCGAHWIVYKDCEVLRAKITNEYIFLYV